MASHTYLAGVTWDHPRAYDCLISASEVFARQTGIRIDWEKRSLQAFADAPIETLAKTYDLIVLDHPHVGQIAASGCLTPLPTNGSTGITSIGGSLESYYWQGRQWAYPVDAACQMAVCRPDLPPRLPLHWEDLFEAEAAIRRLVTPLLPVDAFDMMLTLVASRGEETLPLDRDRFCSDENGLLALRILRRLYELGPDEAVGWNPIDVLELLSESDDFAASPCLFGYVNYARPGFRTHVLHFRDLPTFRGSGQRRGILGGAGMGVSALRGDSDAAVQFAKWVASEPVQSGVYLDNEGQPAHLCTWVTKREDPAYAGFFGGAFETMRTAWTRPRDEWFLHFVDEICEIFPGFFRDRPSEDDFLARINKLYRDHVRAGARS